MKARLTYQEYPDRLSVPAKGVNDQDRMVLCLFTQAGGHEGCRMEGAGIGT